MSVAQITSSFLLLVSSWFGLKAMSITRAAHQQSIAFLQSLSNKQNGWKSVVSSWESTVSQVLALAGAGALCRCCCPLLPSLLLLLLLCVAAAATPSRCCY